MKMIMCTATVKVFLVVILLCVGFSMQEINASKAERVNDFQVSPTKDLVSWRAFGRSWVVHLTLSEVMEDNDDYYHGSLEGDESAVVSFALLPGMGLSGMISTHNDTWWITARHHVGSTDSSSVAVWMYKESSVQIDQTLVPALQHPLETESQGDDIQPEAPAAAAGSDNSNNGRRTLTAYKVAVYVDQKWTTPSNNPWASQASTIGLFNDVNAIYKAAGLGQFTVKYQKQITNTYSSITDMLNYLSNTVNSTLSSFKDQTYTSQAWLVGSNVGGLAYVGTSCNPKGSMNRKTGVMGLANFSRLWTVKTIAHELGHNRGAAHDFVNPCTSTRTTGCQCSLMSYCWPSASNNPGGAKNAFSATSIHEMTSAGCY